MTTAEVTRKVLDALANPPAGPAVPTAVTLRNGLGFRGVLTGLDYEYDPDGRYGRAIFRDANGDVLRHVPLDRVLDF